MEITDTQLDLIHRYIAHELDEQERSKVEQLLQENTSFAEAFQLEKEIHETLSNQKETTFLDQLNEIHLNKLAEETINDRPPIDDKKTNRRFLQIGGAIAAAIALFILAQFLLPNPTLEQIQQQNLPVAANISLKDKSGDATKELELVETTFNNKDFTTSVQLLEPIVTSSNSPEQQLILGKAYFHNKQYEKALATFVSISKSDASHVYRNEANWWMALTHLQLGNIKNCSFMLKVLIQHSPPHAKKAAQLSKQINHLLSEKG